MRALVLGGSRFFGKRLVHFLIEKGWTVSVLNRGKAPDDFGRYVERIQCDRNDSRMMAQKVAGQKWDVIYDQICYDSRQAAAACEIFAGKVGRYVFTSSSSVYQPGPALKEEAFNPKEHYFDTVTESKDDYGEAKRQAESIFLIKAPFPVVAVRLPIVLGVNDYTQRLLFHLEHIRHGQPIHLPKSDVKMSFIDADDAAVCLQFLAESTFVGPVNAASPEPIALRELIRWIESITKKKALLTQKPTEGDHSPFAIPTDWYLDVSRLRGLGFGAKPLDKWLPNLIHQLKAGLQT